MKKCRVCGETKKLDEFHNRADSKDGKQNKCKICSIEITKQWQKDNPDRYTENWQRLTNQRDPLTRKAREYNIHVEDLRNLLTVANGVCQICKRLPTRWVVIDHCHTGLDIRGILCESCNQGLGLFGDDIDRLRSAIQYLEKPKLEYRNYEKPARQKYK